MPRIFWALATLTCLSLTCSCQSTTSQTYKNLQFETVFRWQESPKDAEQPEKRAKRQSSELNHSESRIRQDLAKSFGIKKIDLNEHISIAIDSKQQLSDFRERLKTTLLSLDSEFPVSLIAVVSKVQQQELQKLSLNHEFVVDLSIRNCFLTQHKDNANRVYYHLSILYRSVFMATHELSTDKFDPDTERTQAEYYEVALQDAVENHVLTTLRRLKLKPEIAEYRYDGNWGQLLPPKH